MNDATGERQGRKGGQQQGKHDGLLNIFIFASAR
jgi:hypothetical protein